MYFCVKHSYGNSEWLLAVSDGIINCKNKHLLYFFVQLVFLLNSCNQISQTEENVKKHHPLTKAIAIEKMEVLCMIPNAKNIHLITTYEIENHKALI